MSVSNILRYKGGKVITIPMEASLHEAIQTMVAHGIGALLAVDTKGKLAGIFTERDILRENARHPDAIGQTKVSEIMTTDVFIGLPDDSLDYVMNLMTQEKIRHLPIMHSGELVGIISIGDVVKAKIRQAEIEIRHLTDYIIGKYPG